MGRKKLDEYECDWCGRKVYKPEAPRNSLPDGWQWLYLSGDRISAGTDEEPELVCDSEVNAIASLRQKRKGAGKPQKGYEVIGTLDSTELGAPERDLHPGIIKD